MLLEEGFDQVRFVGGEVVQDDVYVTIGWLRRDDLLPEGDKLLPGVPGSGLTDDLARLWV